jgi:hypothetical protein
MELADFMEEESWVLKESKGPDSSPPLALE